MEYNIVDWKKIVKTILIWCKRFQKTKEPQVNAVLSLRQFVDAMKPAQSYPVFYVDWENKIIPTTMVKTVSGKLIIKNRYNENLLANPDGTVITRDMDHYPTSWFI